MRAANLVRFPDRRTAGRWLAQRLERFVGCDDVIVLALPRGGVPVAAEVARYLGAPLDLMLVRKLGLPGQEELAMGAIASGEIRLLNRDLVLGLRIPDVVVEDVTARELRELHRREHAYRGMRPSPVLDGRTVILVDDGLATGFSMAAAVEAARRQRAARIVVAVPVASGEAAKALEALGTEVVSVITPDPFHSVGTW